MAIGTGTVSMSDIRTEWGRSGAIKMSEMYRGGSHVRSKAANNTGTNLASTVPTSGVISIDDFRGTAKGFKFTFSATATNQNASALFGDDYAVDYPKEIVIDSGVELGATSTAEEALQIDSGASGTITVTNNGTLTGAGGAANGGAGGDAFQADIACTFVNNGTIRSGGGGGGVGGSGGTGGGGRYTSQSSNPTYYTFVNGSDICASLAASYSRAFAYSTYMGGMNQRYNCYGYLQTQVNTNGGAGGAGGSGGVGQGYNQSNTSGSGGSAGAAGGTNAGAGGTGGTGGAGGAFGTNASTGNTGGTGANGNRTNGTGGGAGAGGGAAGAAIRGISSVTLTNNGTITGGQV